MNSIFLSVLAIVISLFSLVVSIMGLVGTRRHNRISVLPKVEPVWESRSGLDTGISLRNNGLGPATIIDLRVRARSGRTFSLMKRAGVVAFLSEVGCNESWVRCFTPDLEASLQKDECAPLISVSKEQERARHEQLWRSLKDVTILIKYRSVYGVSLSDSFPCPS